jgi:hypothetical protein
MESSPFLVNRLCGRFLQIGEMGFDNGLDGVQFRVVTYCKQACGL